LAVTRWPQVFPSVDIPGGLPAKEFTDATIRSCSTYALTCRGDELSGEQGANGGPGRPGSDRGFVVSAIAWLIVVLIVVAVILLSGAFVQRRRRAGGVIATRRKR
jgi:hypothetical protein